MSTQKLRKIISLLWAVTVITFITPLVMYFTPLVNLYFSAGYHLFSISVILSVISVLLQVIYLIKNKSRDAIAGLIVGLPGCIMIFGISYYFVSGTFSGV